jgi:hypothetical protein
MLCLTPHLYTWPRFRGVYWILRYTSDLHLEVLSFWRPDFSLVSLTLVSNLVFSLALYLVFIFIYIYEDSSMICIYIL